MDLEDTIIFCQDELPSASFDVFQDMKKNRELCDLRIKIENMTITAHRVVLAAGIPYFRSLFANNSLEIEKKEIGIEELDSKALESLIDFAYTSKVNITLENAQSLLVASEFLQLSDVKEACVEFLLKRLFAGNVVQICTLAHCINNLQLIESCRRYLQENFESLCKTRDFLDLSPVFFLEIISKDDLHISKEEIVFEAVMNWVKALPLERKNLLPELLNEVRLVFLPTGYLVKRVAQEELIRDSTACRDLIENVKNFHLLPEKEASFLNLKTRRRKFNLDKGIYAICCTTSVGCSLYGCELTKGTWEELKPKATQKRSIVWCAVSAGEDIYLFFDTTVEKFNLRTLDWQALEPTHDSIGDAAALSHKNMIYLFGSSIQAFQNKVRCFDTGKPKWLVERKMKHCRWLSAAAAIQECIYVTGGFSYNDQGCRIPLSTVEKYYSVLGHSRDVASMHTSRAGHGCTSMNEKIYVCGGCTSQSAFSDSAEVYDPMTNQWNSFCSMKINRRHLSLLSHDHKIYSFGGTQFMPSTAFEVYDPESGEWQLGFAVPEGFLHAVAVSTK